MALSAIIFTPQDRVFRDPDAVPFGHRPHGTIPAKVYLTVLGKSGKAEKKGCEYGQAGSHVLFVLQLNHLDIFAHQAVGTVLGIGNEQKRLCTVREYRAQAHAFKIG